MWPSNRRAFPSPPSDRGVEGHALAAPVGTAHDGQLGTWAEPLLVSDHALVVGCHLHPDRLPVLLGVETEARSDPSAVCAFQRLA